MAGLQSAEGCMVIDSVDWVQHVRHTDSHVATAIIAALTHGAAFGRQKQSYNNTQHFLLFWMCHQIADAIIN